MKMDITKVKPYYSKILSVFLIVILAANLSCNDEYECTPIYEFNFLGEHHNLADNESENFEASIRTFNVDSIVTDTLWDAWHYLNVEDIRLSMQVSATFYESGKFSMNYNHPDSIISEGTWGYLSYERYRDIYVLSDNYFCPICPDPDTKYELMYSNGKVGYVEVYERYVESCFTGDLKPHIVLKEYFFYEENGISYCEIFRVDLDSSSIPVNDCYYKDCSVGMGGLGF